jgi:hypothetical protein
MFSTLIEEYNLITMLYNITGKWYCISLPFRKSLMRVCHLPAENLTNQNMIVNFLSDNKFFVNYICINVYFADQIILHYENCKNNIFSDN